MLLVPNKRYYRDRWHRICDDRLQLPARQNDTTQLVTDPKEQRLKDDLGRDFHEVEGRTGALVERPTATLATEDGIAQVGGTR